MELIWLFLVCCFYGSLEAYEPIPPAEWKALAGNGFSVKYFLAVDGYKKGYRPKNIQDVYDKGFRNLRLRCRTGMPNFEMAPFLSNLNDVVDQCLKVGVVPIVSWLNHKAEAEATDDQMQDYVNWWTAVATSLKGKDYRLVYNLFLDLGVEEQCGDQCEALNKAVENKKYGKNFVCPKVCGESIGENQDKYNKWTKAVVNAIRAIDPNRILILASPRKTGDALKDIPSDIYKDDRFMMAEWHLYESGPRKPEGAYWIEQGSPAPPEDPNNPSIFWVGDGNTLGKQNMVKALSFAKEWTADTGILTYSGGWTPLDNLESKITQEEAINFAKYFVQQMDVIDVPWSLNKLSTYYNTKAFKWYNGPRPIKGKKIEVSKILDAIMSVMKKPGNKDQFDYNEPDYDEAYDDELFDIDVQDQ